MTGRSRSRRSVSLAWAVCAIAVTAVLASLLHPGGPSKSGGAVAEKFPAPQFRAAASSATSRPAHALRLEVPADVAAGDVLLAALSVRLASPASITAPAGWRPVQADRSSRSDRLAQVVYVRVASRSERASYRWSFDTAAAAAGGILAYSGIDAARPIAARSGRSARAGGERGPARSLQITAPSLTTRARNAVVVSLFGTGGSARTQPPAGATERYEISSRSRTRGAVTLAAADFVQRRAGAVGSRSATSSRSRACPNRSTAPCRRTRRAIGQLIALRAGAPPASEPDDSPGARLPAPLPESSGPTFHVSTSGSDSGPGSAERPWRTVQKAIDVLAPGETALVHEGTYTQALKLGRPCRRSAPCTIEAAPGDARPQLRAPGDHVLRVDPGGAYWRFRGLLFRDSDITSGGLVDIYGDHLEFADNELTRSGDQGFYLSEVSRRVQILGNWIHHSGLGRTHQSHGVYLQGDDHLVANNVITDHRFGFGIQVYDRGLRAIVVNNTITHNGQSGIVVGGEGGVSRVVVRNNVLAFNADHGLAWDSTCPDGSAGTTYADHNVIFDNRSEAIDPQFCPAASTAGGNRTSDPRFVDADARDLRLRDASSALGYGSAPWAPPRDRDGVTRRRSGGPAAGAYERP